MSDTLKKAKEGAVWGMLITDAMSMPVHWYYNPSDIKTGYGGWLTGYNAPERRHPSSILTLSATGRYFVNHVYACSLVLQSPGNQDWLWRVVEWI